METGRLQAIMIRGDRLLLALDVIHYVARYCRVDCPNVAQEARGIHEFTSNNPRRCSRAKVLAVLCERCSFTPKPCPRGPRHDMYCTGVCDDLIFKDGTPGRIQSFLRDQQDAWILNEQRFALVEWVVDHTAHCTGLDVAFVSSLFRLIGSGELTEEDFQEDAR